MPVVAAATVIACARAAGRSLWSSAEAPRLAVAALLTALAFRWFRFNHLAVFALALALFGAQDSLPRRIERAVVWLSPLLALTALLFVRAQYGSLPAALRARSDDYEAASMPEIAAQLLAESGLQGNVSTPAAWGGFVLYKAWPRLRVTLDGRQASSTRVNAIARRIDLAWTHGDPLGRLPALYSALPADFALAQHPMFPRGEPTEPWVRVLETPVADLYVRRGPSLDAQMERLRRVVVCHRAGHTHCTLPDP